MAFLGNACGAYDDPSRGHRVRGFGTATDAENNPKTRFYPMRADEEVAEFKKAINENRAATGARLLFP